MEDERKYNENIDYCDYVFEKNHEYFLGLDFDDVQNIANLYVSELESRGIDYESEIVEDDELLLEIVKEYLSDFERIDENVHLEEGLLEIKLRHEKVINSMGGYGYSDSYDDESIENRNADFALKFNRRKRF